MGETKPGERARGRGHRLSPRRGPPHGTGADDYNPIMAVLESSLNDLTPAEIVVELAAAGVSLDERTIEAGWTSCGTGPPLPRAWTSRGLFATLTCWPGTGAGRDPGRRQVERFHATVLAVTPAMRKIRCRASLAL